MKASDFIAKKIASFTTHVFNGQGGSVVHILDSLSKIKKIKIVPSQNEQGASLAADAYTRVSGKIGVVVATSGPGILNCLQGMACSYYDSIPGLYISGAPIRRQLKKNLNLRQLGFQEMDVVSMVKNFTKYSKRILNPDEIEYEIDKCHNLAFSGRPGPCLLDIPDDVQRAFISKYNQKKFIPYLNKFKSEKIKIDKARKLLNSSEKPLIVIGGGVKNPNIGKYLKNFIDKYNLPYSPTWGAIDLFNKNEKLNLGSFGVYATEYGNKIVQDADLLIILGCRMNATLTGSYPKFFSTKSKKIHVDIDLNEQKNENKIKIDLSIHTSIKKFLKGLDNKRLQTKKRQNWIQKITLLKSKYPVVKKRYNKELKYVNPYIFFDKLADFIKTKDIVIPDASANLVWTYQAFNFRENLKVFTSLNHSPMGYSVAAAIGASFATKSKNKVFAIIGDGSMQMNIQEIQNIKHFNLPIKIIIINNNGYGMVKQTIDTWLNKNYVGCDKKSDLSLPDYDKVFKSHSIKTFKIQNNTSISNVLRNFVDYKGPSMCNVSLHPNQQITPKVKFGNSIDIMV